MKDYVIIYRSLSEPTRQEVKDLNVILKTHKIKKLDYFPGNCLVQANEDSISQALSNNELWQFNPVVEVPFQNPPFQL